VLLKIAGAGDARVDLYVNIVPYPPLEHILWHACMCARYAAAMPSKFLSNVAEAMAVIDSADASDFVDVVSTASSRSLRAGGKLMICGNGGSAADSQHLAAEFTVRLRPHLSRTPMAAISLSADPVMLTACANDFGFEMVFARGVQALGRPDDILLLLSTSGRSTNVIEAAHAAQAMGIPTYSMTGTNGGTLQECSDLNLLVPTYDTAIAQLGHLAVGHAIAHAIEESLLASGDIQGQ
jgi:D-sedoheptulose 7-phosphate isomerase